MTASNKQADGRPLQQARHLPLHAHLHTELIDHLWANTIYFKGGLKRLGFDTGASETPITPVMMGDSARAQRFSQRLFEEGVFAQAVVYPTVALEAARIRTIVTAEHTKEQLDRCLAAFDKVGRELGLIAH